MDGPFSDSRPPSDAMIDAPEGPPIAAGSCATVDPNLVACYPFEDLAMPLQVQDATRYHNDGMAQNVGHTAGRFGQAIVLSGSTVQVPESASLDIPTELTLEVWGSPTALPGSMGRASLIDNHAQYSFYVLGGGALSCTVGGNTVTTGTGVVAIGAWQHLACAYGIGALSVYKDGVEVGRISATGAISTSGTIGTSIGLTNPVGDNYTGYLDTLRIWKSLRTPEQIRCAAGLPGC